MFSNVSSNSFRNDSLRQCSIIERYSPNVTTVLSKLLHTSELGNFVEWRNVGRKERWNTS